MKKSVGYLDGPEVKGGFDDPLPERWQTEEDQPDQNRNDGYPNAMFPVSTFPMDSMCGYPAPGLQLGYQLPPRRHNEKGHVGHIYRPPLPFSAVIPGGVQPGKKIVIEGQAGFQRFNVQITDRSQVDVALFFSPIINWGSESGTTVMNIRCNGCWGHEVRTKDQFPFEAEKFFRLEISIQEHEYRVVVDDTRVYMFQCRLKPMEKYDTLFIEGDLFVQQIQFH